MGSEMCIRDSDLDHKETTVTYETALKHIWREDNIAGGRWADDRGPWTYK